MSKKVRVIKPFQGDFMTDSLALEEGDIIVVLTDSVSGKVYGRKMRTGEEGYFDMSYCVPVTEENSFFDSKPVQAAGSNAPNQAVGETENTRNKVVLEKQETFGFSSWDNAFTDEGANEGEKGKMSKPQQISDMGQQSVDSTVILPTAPNEEGNQYFKEPTANNNEREGAPKEAELRAGIHNYPSYSSQNYQKPRQPRYEIDGTFEHWLSQSDVGHCCKQWFEACPPIWACLFVLMIFLNFVLLIVGLSVQDLTTVTMTENESLLVRYNLTNAYSVLCSFTKSTVYLDYSVTSTSTNGNQHQSIPDNGESIYYKTDGKAMPQLCSYSKQTGICLDLGLTQAETISSAGNAFLWLVILSILPLGFACYGRGCCFGCGGHKQYTSACGIWFCCIFQVIALITWLSTSQNTCYFVAEIQASTGDIVPYIPYEHSKKFQDKLYFVGNGASVNLLISCGVFAFVGGLIALMAILVYCMGGRDIDLVALCVREFCRDDFAGSYYCWWVGGGDGGGGGGHHSNNGNCDCSCHGCDCHGCNCDCGNCGGCDCSGLHCGGC